MSHEIFIEYTSPIMTQFQNEHACSGDFGQKISQNTANLAHLPTLGGHIDVRIMKACRLHGSHLAQNQGSDSS